MNDLIDQALQAERLGRFDEARQKLREAIAPGEGEGEGDGESPQALDARLRLGKLLVQGGPAHSDEAEAVLTAARRQAEASGAPRQGATAIHLLALLERGRGNLDAAARLLEESPAPRQASAPGPALGQYYHYRGLVEADRGQLHFAERLLFRALQLYQEARYDPGLSEVCDSLANLLLRRGLSQAALAFARKSLELKRRLKDRFGEAIALGTLGRVYLLQARTGEAAEAFSQDLAIARELDDTRGVGIMLNSLGEAALVGEDLDSALEYYRQSLAAGCGPFHAIHAELGLGNVHLLAGRLDEAAAACDRMAALLEVHPRGHGMPDALDGLRGAIASRRGDHEQGERLLTTALERLEGSRQQPLYTINLLYELRNLYQARGETARAVAVMTRALDLLAEWGSERGVADVEGWLRTVDAPALTRLALQRHVPGYLVEEILGGRMQRPRPRRQVVTVLFCDAMNYTRLSEGLEPEQVVELLNEWFTEATRAIRRQGGIVDKFIGDAIMAVFGVPEPRDDDAARAVRAALDMRDALASLNLRREALGFKTIEVGIGINTGEAVIGFIGSHFEQSFAAIGDVTNTASRLESKTRDYPGCDILISQATEEIQRRAGVAETTYLGLAELKGKGQKVPVYQVLGPREAAS
jgi:class 3 adenylate cyclase/ATP/maltotriose-dependent transcriptional regulator MalT